MLTLNLWLIAKSFGIAMLVFWSVLFAGAMRHADTGGEWLFYVSTSFTLMTLAVYFTIS